MDRRACSSSSAASTRTIFGRSRERAHAITSDGFGSRRACGDGRLEGLAAIWGHSYPPRSPREWPEERAARGGGAAPCSRARGGGLVSRAREALLTPVPPLQTAAPTRSTRRPRPCGRGCPRRSLVSPPRTFHVNSPVPRNQAMCTCSNTGTTSCCSMYGNTT